MTSFVWLFPACLLVASGAVAQPPQPRRFTGVESLQGQYAALKRAVTESATKMSEADYFFKPTPDVKAYGQLWTHVADAQYEQCSAAKGVANPRQGQPRMEDSIKTKAEVMNAVADSFAYCDDLFASLTEANAQDMVLAYGRTAQFPRTTALAEVLLHGREMYGIGTVYLRLKGLVPPTTEAAAAARGRGAAETPGRGGRGQ